MTTLAEFDKMLRYHDWYFAFSDDHSTYLSGQRSVDALVRLAKESEDHAKLFNGWRDLHFTGPSFSTEKFTRDQLDAVRKELGVI